MMRGNSSPINGENQRFWKHLSKFFLPGRNSRCTFSQTPPHPYMGKIGQIDTASGKFFQHVIHHLISKIGPFGNLFRKIFSNCFARVSTVIAHPCESCQHHLLLAAPYCPLPFYVKIGASDTISSKFLTGWFLPRNIAFRRRHQRGTSLLFSPLKSTWRKSAILETLTDDFWKFSSSACC